MSHILTMKESTAILKILKIKNISSLENSYMKYLSVCQYLGSHAQLQTQNYENVKLEKYITLLNIFFRDK